MATFGSDKHKAQDLVSVAIKLEGTDNDNDSLSNQINDGLLKNSKSAFQGPERQYSSKNIQQQKFYCGLCHQVVDNKADHVKVHAGDKRHKCQECGKCFFKSENLTKHIKTHNIKPSYICCQCEIPFFDEILFKEHLKTHETLEEVSETYTCEFCPKTESSIVDLKSHVLNVHKKSWDLHKCSECEKEFLFEAHLKSHQEKDHPVIPKKIVCQKKCRMCELKFSSPEQLKVHMTNAHSQKRKYTCGNCTKKFYFERGLADHIRKFHNAKLKERIYLTTYTCEVCGIIYRNKEYYQNHCKTHLIRHRKKILECEFCRKMFPDEKSLIFHEKWDHYYCRMCKHHFMTPSAYKLHLKELHTQCCQRTPMYCKYCGKSWRLKCAFHNHHLEKHPNLTVMLACRIKKCTKTAEGLSFKEGVPHHSLKFHEPISPTKINFSHTNDQGHICNADPLETKAFKCEKCQLEFEDEDELKLHTKIEHKKEETNMENCCLECGKCFSTSENLVKHMKNYKEIYKCEFCAKTESSIMDLKSHMLNFHEKSWDVDKSLECEQEFLFNPDLQSDEEKDNPDTNENPKNETFQCTLCHKMLSSLSFLMVHERCEHFYCRICKHHFRSKSAYKRHLREILPKCCKNSFMKCKLCGELIKNKCPYYAHHLEKHPNTTPIIKCISEDCSKTVTSIRMKNGEDISEHIFKGRIPILQMKYKFHIRKDSNAPENNDEADPSENKGFKCEKCELEFVNGDELKLHAKSEHKNEETKSDLQSHQEKDHPEQHKSLTDTTLECVICGSVLRDLQSLTTHERYVHFYCRICKHCFRTKSVYNKHFKQLQPKCCENYMKCKLCEEHIKDKCPSYAHHLEKHPNTTPILMCVREECSKTFTGVCFKDGVNLSADLLQGRIPILRPENNFSLAKLLKDNKESEKKVFQCQKCPLEFASEEDLKLHMKTEHVIKKKTKCTLCAKTFPGDEALQEHWENVHNTKILNTDEELYACEVCSATFKTRRLWKNHLETHVVKEIKVPCRFCAFTFQNDKKLIHHETTAHFYCRICKHQFRQESSLNQPLTRTLPHCCNSVMVCKLCWRRFKYKCCFYSHHLQSHLAETPTLECQKCHKTHEFTGPVYVDGSLGSEISSMAAKVSTQIESEEYFYNSSTMMQSTIADLENSVIKQENIPETNFNQNNPEEQSSTDCKIEIGVEDQNTNMDLDLYHMLEVKMEQDD